MTANTSTHKRIAFRLIILIVGIIYSNSLDCSWHFDDYPNIVWNTRLHLSDLYPQSLTQTFYTPTTGDPQSSGSLYRPISGLTFGLNWFLGQDQVFGYHVVNVMIHGLAGLLIYAIILLLLEQSPVPSFSQYEGHAPSIALLSAVLWAIHPIQTQAVTYIVQRMTSLAALFCLLSIYGYVRARITPSMPGRVLFFSLCMLSFGLAVGSKENSAILPAGILLIEIIFFRSRSEQNGHRKNTRNGNRLWLWCLTVLVLSALLGATWFFLNGNPLSILDGYDSRPFTLWERLLTQFRVLVMYLGQIVYPVENRLSFIHDVAISKSLTDPWTTLPAILLILSLAGTAVWKWKRWPIWSFAILFYFMMHSIESSIIPLELVYEHRNYLPSAFLFFPVSIGMVKLLNDYDRKSPLLKQVITLSIAALIMAMGIGTYSRNRVYQTEKSFWEDAIAKAPGMGRSYHNLAADHYEKMGMDDRAMQLYELSLQGKDMVPKHRAFTYNNMGNLYQKKKDYKKAIQHYQAARSIDPSDETTAYNLTVSTLGSGDSGKALQLIDQLLTSRPDHPEYLCLKGFILLKFNSDMQASTYFRKALKSNPYHVNSLFYLGLALIHDHNHAASEHFLKQAMRLAPNDIWIHFGRIELFSVLQNRSDLDMSLTRLFESFPLERIIKSMNSMRTDPLSPPLSYGIIAKNCKERLGNMACVLPNDD